MTDTHPYSLRQIEQMLGLSARVIAGLIAAGFVTPQRGSGNAYRFSFQDVVLLRTAHRLREAKIPPRRLLRSLKQLRAKLPAQMPLSGLRIKVIGNEVAVRDADAVWEDPSGQLVMDFELAPTLGADIHTGSWSAAGAPAEASPSVGAASNIAGRQRSSSAAATTTVDPDKDAADLAPVGIATTRRGTKPPVRAAATSSDLAAIYDHAVSLEAERDIAAAANRYRELLTLHPAHVDAAINLSALLCDGGHCAQALAICDQAIAAGNEPVALLHFNRAIALEDLGDRDSEARRAYERALQLDPALADAHYNLGRLHEKNGHRQAALRHFSAYRRLERQ